MYFYQRKRWKDKIVKWTKNIYETHKTESKLFTYHRLKKRQITLSLKQIDDVIPWQGFLYLIQKKWEERPLTDDSNIIKRDILMSLYSSFIEKDRSWFVCDVKEWQEDRKMKRIITEQYLILKRCQLCHVHVV